MDEFLWFLKHRITDVIAISVAVVATYVMVFSLRYLPRMVSKIPESDNKEQRNEPAPADDNVALPTCESLSEKQFVLMEAYHSEGLQQCKISFWLSIIFAALGFLVIISAVLTSAQARRTGVGTTTAVPLIAGTIIDAVSALFFVQSNRARQLMIAFFDKLRTDRKLEEALRLCAQIPDSRFRNRLHSVLVLSLSQASASDEVLDYLRSDERDYLRAGDSTQTSPAQQISKRNARSSPGNGGAGDSVTSNDTRQSP